MSGIRHLQAHGSICRSRMCSKGEKMKKIKIADLVPHPMNTHYFDDISGDGWNDLLQSIRTSGVTNAITVTKEGVIISGHQRVRACRLLGIDEIPAYVVEFTEEELKKHKKVLKEK